MFLAGPDWQCFSSPLASRSDRGASLYSTFGSKDELIRAYLEQRMEITKARLRAAAEAHDDPREALLSVFGVQAARRTL